MRAEERVAERRIQDRGGALKLAVNRVLCVTAAMAFGGLLQTAAGAQAGAAPAVPATAGQGAPAAVQAAPATPGQRTLLPSAASPGMAQTPPVSFPPVDPKNFTSSSPTIETVNSFLHALWGFDENRVWSVAAIQPTQAPGVVAVHVFVAEKSQSGRMAQTTLFITPDGGHAIAGEVVRFSAQPFAETRALLAKEADGPARGAADKQLEMVVFTDLECTACKAAQATVDQLVQQYPQAHVVVEDMPLTRMHPFAYQAAAVGHCVRQSKGDAGYFAYANAVMGMQADLTREKVDATLSAAVKAAGGDPAAAMACAATPAAKAAVDAVVRLGTEAGVTDVPTLVVNGRALPLGQVPVPALERIIAFQGTLDGFPVHQQPSLSTLK